MLADTCGGATLVQMQAICDLITDPRYPKKVARYGVEFAIDVGEKIQADRAKSLSVESLEREVLRCACSHLQRVSAL